MDGEDGERGYAAVHLETIFRFIIPNLQGLRKVYNLMIHHLSVPNG